MISRDILIGVMQYIPHCKALGMCFVDHGADWVLYKLPYSDKLVGFPDSGVIAGGAIYSLLDYTSGSAVSAALGHFPDMATLDLRVDYLKPATPRQDILARVQCYKLTRSVAFVRGVAYHDDITRPIAHSTGTFMFSQKPFSGASSSARQSQ